ncbi:MAG: hypothetical protein BWY83_02072 [bacterium ADurb.Bin478]|nr:MAG: hypothetical protein BWY83_02072 [bacterium ADurb.Bin478]
MFVGLIEIGQRSLVQAVHHAGAEKVVRPAQAAAQGQGKAPALLTKAIPDGAAHGVIDVETRGGGRIHHPGLGIAQIHRAIVASEIPIDAGALAGAHQVGHGQTHGTDKTVILAPAGRHVGGIRGLFLHLELEIHLVLVDGRDLGLHIGEIIQHPHFALTALQQGAVEIIAGQDAQLTTDHFLPGLAVAHHLDLVDARLFALGDEEMNVQLLVLILRLAGHGLRIDIAAIIIQGADIFHDRFFQLFLAVDLAFGKAQLAVELLGGKDLVALKSDIAKGVLRPFVDPDIDIHLVVQLVVRDRIAQDFDVAISMVRIKIEQQPLILFVFFTIEIAAAQPGVLFGFFQLLAQLFVGKHDVAVKIDALDLHFAAFIKDKTHVDPAAVVLGVLLHGFDLCQQVAFFLVLVQQFGFGARDHARIDHLARIKTGGGFDIFLFKLFIALIFKLVQSRIFRDANDDKNAFGQFTLHHHADVGKQVQPPQLTDRLLDAVAGDLHSRCDA